MPALALILHLAECAATGQRGAVTAQAALRAAAWCDYLEAHARRCYGLLVDDGLRSAQALADKVSQGKLSDGFTARDVRRNHRDTHARHAMQLRAVAVTAALTLGDRYLSLSREDLSARIEEMARNCSIIAVSNPTSVNTAPK
jgi:hypothetical protein